MALKSIRKPRIFLSHSKKDKRIIERIANDLRSSQVDAWYDDWEIPPGESLRQRIFSDGIEGSDLFVAYLTPNALQSRWCQAELDSGFVADFERQGGCFAAFVDSDETRNQLPIDVRALRVPVLNDTDYENPLRQLLSRAWTVTAKALVRRAEAEAELAVLHAQKELADQKLAFERLRNAGTVDLDEVVGRLRAVRVNYRGQSVDLATLFNRLGPSIATGSNTAHLMFLVRPLLNVPLDTVNSRVVDAPGADDVIGPLVILGLVETHPPSERWDELYYLTDLGKRVLRML
jgi:hypothetical protein